MPMLRRRSKLGDRSAQLHGVLVDEGVGRELQVLRSRPQAHAPRVVVVRAVAGTEISAPIASIWLRDAAQVSAHTDHDKPLRLLAPLSICGGVTHRRGNGIVLPGRVDHVGGALANKDWLAAPLHDEILALTYRSEVDLDNACSPDILCRPHRVDQLAGHRSYERGHNEAR